MGDCGRMEGVWMIVGKMEGVWVIVGRLGGRWVDRRIEIFQMVTEQGIMGGLK